MKNLKTPCAALVFVLTTMVACRKENSEQLAPSAVLETTEVAADSAQASTIESAWLRTDSWNELKQPTLTVYMTHLKANISSTDADNALVRVFRQSGEKTVAQSLPFEETVGSTKYYWYYTVTEGDIMLAVDVYGDAATNPGETNSFKYVIFNEGAVKKFEAAGTSKEDLINLPLEKLNK